MLTTAVRSALRRKGIGFIVSPTDERDHVRPLSASRVPLPAEAMELDAYIVQRNQGATNSCTAHAIDHGVQALCGTGRGPRGREYTLRSVAAPYWLGRSLSGLQRQDEGDFLRNALKARSHNGAPSEQAWPLRILTINRQPPGSTYRLAHPWRGLRYSRLLADNGSFHGGIVQALAARKPVVIGWSVYASALDDHGPDTLDAQDGSYVGGHATILSGWLDRGDRLRMPGSWGTSYRDGGRVWVTRDFVDRYVTEAWALEGFVS